MNAREALEKEIADLQQQLKARREALKALERLDPHVNPARGPFTGKRPLAAIRKILTEHGGPMSEDEVTKKLIDGGITAGRKRAAHNVRISIDVSVKAGSLIRRDGMLRLPT